MGMSGLFFRKFDCVDWNIVAFEELEDFFSNCTW